MPREPMPRTRGYVLLIVLVVALAASMAAFALLDGGLHGHIGATHTDLTHRTRSIGEAGMNHALEFLRESSENALDFDAVLDVDLDAYCDPLPPSASAEDNIPPAATGFTPVTFVEKSYGMRLFAGGAYLVRFDDDDDDLPANGRWKRLTGNNEGETNRCYEGPPAVDGTSPSPHSLTGNHTSWEANPLRDRNASLWITVIALYPVSSAQDLDSARHRAVLRKYHTMVRVPRVAGIQVRGDLRIRGGGTFGACSPIGAVEVDGTASHAGTSGGGCACATSLADSWSSIWTHCSESSLIDCDATVTTTTGPTVTLPGCAAGKLRTPGPSVPSVPDVDSEADSLIDFSRSCVFYVDNDGSSGNDNSVWFWDATRSIAGTTCAAYEGSGGAMPRPNPAGGFPSACWTPLLLQMNAAHAAGSNDPGAGACYWTPFVDGTGGSLATEKTLLGSRCAWAPDGTSTGTHGVARLNESDPTTWDGLSRKLAALGMPQFPTGTTLNKPAWASACTVHYAPFEESPSTYSCQRDGTGCVANNAGAADNIAIAYVDADPALPWFPVRDHDDAIAVPAGVYFYPASVALSGSNFQFAQGAHPLFFGDGKPMEDYLLATIATPATIDLQKPGYFFGAGQDHEGGAFPQYRLPSLIANGDVTLRGSSTQSIGGSILLRGNMAWEGSGELFLYGELHGNGNFAVGGTGEFWWLYEVPLTDPGLASGAALPTQTVSLH